MSGAGASPILALDVDGVIIDGFPRNRWDETLEADLGIDPARLTEEFFKPHWDEIMRGLKPVEPPLTAFLQDYGSAVTTAQFIAYWHGNDANIQHNVIEAALSWQSRTGGRLALATNQDLTRARYIKHDLGLGAHFDAMVVSCQIGSAKPEPEYFWKADEVIERAPNQPVIFLDDMEANVIAARTHGWEAHQVESIAHGVEILQGLSQTK